MINETAYDYRVITKEILGYIVHHVEFKEIVGDFGESISSENSNSYDIIKNSAFKSTNNLISSLEFVILLFIVFIVGFLKFKYKY